jgi:hypothetical protein
VPPGRKIRWYSSCSVGIGAVSITAHQDKLRRTFVFASIGICGSRSALRCIRGVKHRCTIFSCSCGTERDFTKSASGHVMPNLCLASGWICGSRSALRCVRGMKRRRTIFLAQVGPVRIAQKHIGTPYTLLEFFHPVVFGGHVVPCASRA